MENSIMSLVPIDVLATWDKQGQSKLIARNPCKLIQVECRSGKAHRSLGLKHEKFCKRIMKINAVSDSESAMRKSRK